MKEARSVRKRSTSEERRKILESYQQGQSTQKDFAEDAGICLSTLQRWLREDVGTDRGVKKPFIEIPNLLSVSSGLATYRLESGGGWKLEIRSGFKVEELEGLLRTLQAL